MHKTIKKYDTTRLAMQSGTNPRATKLKNAFNMPDLAESLSLTISDSESSDATSLSTSSSTDGSSSSSTTYESSPSYGAYESSSSSDEDYKKSPIKEFIPAKGNTKNIASASKNQAYLANKTPKNLLDDNSNRNIKLWVAKSSPSDLVAYCEVVVQEFYRLLAPELFQPKARLAHNKKSGDSKLGTATEYMEQLEPLWESETPLSSKAAKKIQAPAELGLSTFLSYFFNETDLKPDHIGKKGTRIDSDYALSALIHHAFKTKSAITDENIQTLPYPANYNANQWLDQIIGGERRKTNAGLLFFGLSAQMPFRNSVNKGILRLLTLPDTLITEFIAVYVPDLSICRLIRDFILNRKNELLIAIQLNTSFKTYIGADQAKNELSDYIRYACDFQTVNKRELISYDQRDEFYNTMKTRHQMLKQTLKSGPSIAASYQSSPTATYSPNTLFHHSNKHKPTAKFQAKEISVSTQQTHSQPGKL
jgi:hypothetical protein